MDNIMMNADLTYFPLTLKGDGLLFANSYCVACVLLYITSLRSNQ